MALRHTVRGSMWLGLSVVRAFVDDGGETLFEWFVVC